MKELLKRLAIAEKEANEADQAYEADPENIEKEEAFDRAYKAEYDLYMKAANEIVKITSGKIDIKTAAAMIQTRRKELETLFA